MVNLSEQSIIHKNDILTHYQNSDEATRLQQGLGQLEFVRTKDILERFLPLPPATILDVGGGAGIYSCWLARKGYDMHLLDMVPEHVKHAQRASRQQPDHPLASIRVGDTRNLDRDGTSVDTVLLLGPLYHLPERTDRLLALQEAYRVLRNMGTLFAVGISRFASTLDGLFNGFLDDPEFAEIVKRDLTDGQHRNPNNRPGYFTTAYFHHPEELRTEVEEAGFTVEQILPIESVGWLLQNFEIHWQDQGRRKRLLAAIHSLENEYSLLGVSGHIIAIAKRECEK